MNITKRLLRILDKVYGFVDKKESKFHKMRQYFDEKTNEHVFVIEYRVIRGKRRVPDIRVENESNVSDLMLLKEINDCAKWHKGPTKRSPM